MKISTIQIKNYRSIKDAKISLGDMTVLLGKNNEGKSNLLMAVNVAISALQIYGELRRRGIRHYHVDSNLRRYADDKYYIWERDFPISEQKGRKRDKKTVFVLEFVLDENEVIEFKKNIGSQLNGSLQIRVVFDNTGKQEITVVKKGKGSKYLNSNSQKVARYIAEHIEFNYIPAVRTVEHTMGIIDEQIFERLKEVKDTKEYKEALNVIDGIEKKILTALSEEVNRSLIDFLPEIKSVTIKPEDIGGAIRRSRDYTFWVDDGEETNLRNKGDGVKSLVAMSLLKSKKSMPNSASVIAIEEPESHLHPSAIEALRKAILALSGSSQVVVTTHNPQFVNRNEIASNIIVDDGNAVAAANIRCIREVLGVRLSDNLFGAKLLLYVEGETDKVVLNSILMTMSKKIASAIKSNELVIQPMSGVDHIEMHLMTARTMVANFYVLVDGDQAGKVAVQNAIQKGLLNNNDYLLTHFSDLAHESELEDMLESDVYHDEILKNYGVDISTGSFKARNKKWSDRIKEVFINSGKLFGEKDLSEIKWIVARQVISCGNSAIRSEGRIMLKKLIDELEKRL